MAKPPSARSVTTNCISRKQALNLIEAMRFAEGIGIPLNTFVTIAFKGSSIYPGDGPPTQAQTRACRAAALATVTRLAAAHGFSTAYAWALERVTGRGLHVHMLCHLPAQAHEQLRDALAQRIKRTFGWDSQAGNWHFKPLEIAPECLEGLDPARKLLYLLKGLDPEVSTYRRNMTKGFLDQKPQGRIYGKRVGVSRNIDQSARRQSGRRERATLADLDVRRHVDRRQKMAMDAARRFWAGESARPSSG